MIHSSMKMSEYLTHNEQYKIHNKVGFTHLFFIN